MITGRAKMRVRINWFTFLFLFVFSTVLQASNIINIQLRFYQGFNEKQKITVSDRYFFLKENNQQIFSYREITEEINSLKSIYNLKEVKNITNLSMEFIDNKKTQRRDLYFKKKDIKISLKKCANKKNKFELKIFKELNSIKPLMNTEIILPVDKATVIGFRDKEGILYFFSLYRKDETKVKKQSKYLIPEIVNEYIPQYPEEALQAGKKGDVILEGEVNKNGKIKNIKIWKGDPLLNKAALTAFRNWEFTPYNVGSSGNLIKVVLILVFEINKEKKQEKNYKKKFEQIKKTDIWKQIKNSKDKEDKSKPWLLKIWIIQGEKNNQN